MTHVNGMVLIMALVFLLIMSLLVSATLLVSQLSYKAAYSGQQQLQLAQHALQQHLQQTQLIADDAETQSLADCPASYAAWSVGALQCEVVLHNTETYSDNRLFYAGYSSIVLRQRLVAGDRE